MEDTQFRFSSKIHYEIELAKLLSELNKMRNSKKSARLIKKLEVEYEDLIEEYMRFCGTGAGVDGSQ